jgi:hypothetical protein
MLSTAGIKRLGLFDVLGSDVWDDALHNHSILRFVPERQLKPSALWHCFCVP